MDRIGLFIGLLVNRLIPPYPLQHEIDDGHWIYICKENRITRKVIERHFNGDITIGLYPGEDSMTKWTCVDIDSRDRDEVLKVVNSIKVFGAAPLVEDTGGRGYHSWILFDRKVENRKAKFFGELIAGKNHEVFPKQEHTDKKAVGNLIKAPLGIHRKYGGWSFFVDENFKKIDDPFGYLQSVPRFNLDRFLKTTYKCAKKHFSNNDKNKLVIPNKFKPCLMKVIADGSEKGSRNAVAHIISSESKRVGYSRDFATGLLFSWNSRNQPSLSLQELKFVVGSVYKESSTYEYGCNGKLLEYVDCTGKNRCDYFQKIRGFKK